jgi:hypothetical protein
MVFESPAFCKEIEFLAREVEDEETAAKMISIAVNINGIPVVTKTPKGEVIGVRWDAKAGCLGVGFGWCTGLIE